MTDNDTPTSTDQVTFYSLPAELLDVGMSTDDGQDILAVDTNHHALVVFDVYTPADDPDEDNDRRCAPEARTSRRLERVKLAVFPNTPLDASTYPQAIIATAAPDA